MVAPLRAKSKLVVFKTEVTEGTDPTPLAANAILTKEFKATPMDGDDVARDLDRPYFGADEQFPTGLRVRIQFKVELVPSGTAGTAPKWGPLLRACGCSETIVAATSVTYAPITDSMESGTFWYWHDGVKQVANGCRGNVTMRFPAQGLPYLEFDFMGLYADPTDTAQISSPVYSGFKKPAIVSKAKTTFALNSVSLVMKEVALALNNQLEPRLLVGSERILITDRDDALSMRVEATPMATFNPFSLAKAQTQMAMQVAHNDGAGYISTLAAPYVALKRPSGWEEAQSVLEWALEGKPLPSSGNDQWSLTLT